MNTPNTHQLTELHKQENGKKNIQTSKGKKKLKLFTSVKIKKKTNQSTLPLVGEGSS